jgi:hypothetical protein
MQTHQRRAAIPAPQLRLTSLQPSTTYGPENLGQMHATLGMKLGCSWDQLGITGLQTSAEFFERLRANHLPRGHPVAQVGLLPFSINCSPVG